ncbi:nucleoporin NUP85 [Cladorrhinum sp. PSN259]|nr:nucleoporin NUP85 [Cladorrhinum sp. PSN259]
MDDNSKKPKSSLFNMGDSVFGSSIGPPGTPEVKGLFTTNAKGAMNTTNKPSSSTGMDFGMSFGSVTGGGDKTPEVKGLFSTTNNNNKSEGGGLGLFGGNNNNKIEGGGLFGNLNKTESAKPLFGGGNNSAPKGLFSSKTDTAKPLFSSNNDSAPKSLFGSNAETAKPLFSSNNDSAPKNLFSNNNGFSLSGGDKTPEPKGLFTTANAGHTGPEKNIFFPQAESKQAAPKPLFSAPAPAPAPAPPKPLGRSINAAGSAHMRKPSRLSRSVMAEEFEDDDEELPPANTAPRSFNVPFDDDDDSEDMEEDDDMWLDAGNVKPGARHAAVGDESDLLMFNTPAVTERVRREAEELFRATARQSVGPGGAEARRKEFRFAALAKDVYMQLGTAPVTESPQVILETEVLIQKLYDEGVGEEEDDEKMDDTLAAVSGKVAKLWTDYIGVLPQPHEEHAAEIGPGPHATSFEKANYLANLALQLHHTRYDDVGGARAEPLPETLFRWLNEYHDMYGNQVDEILRHRPSPACHSLFWQAVFIALLRGKLADAISLLRNAGWGHIRRGQRGEYAYTGKALDSVELAVEETLQVLEMCPGYDNNWEIWSSDWTMFRVRAQGSLEHLRRFAEGKDNSFGDSTFSASMASTRSPRSMAGLARRAESQVPWEIYENLNIVFDIILGQQGAIMETAQDWLEATIGLFGWWNEAQPNRPEAQNLSRSMALVLTSNNAVDDDNYLDRLARAFHAAVESDFHFNSQNPIEVGMACVFEDNIKAVIGLLRGWSLPIAAAVAEIASLGKWLPPHQPSGIFGFEDLDMDDLEVLGVDPGAPDEVDGIKDSTLVQYAQALAEYDELSSVRDKAGVQRDGWELAIHVFGRMDSAQRSEEMMKELVQHLIDNLHVDSNAMVDRLWVLLNELGMVPYAEDTAESYGEILARDSHRYGEAMWYYALAHRPHKVREVMNLLMSYSLIQSTAFPPTNELDDYLYKLLNDRNNTLENLAVQDMEGAELLGKMLSGYASLRQFYDIRDNESALPNATPHARRQQAATALISVIASSDDNIRGGLFDQTRDGIVSEDFLLALLGEALVFVTDPNNTNVYHGQLAEPVITLDQIDIILKAIEDLQAVGERVYTACEEFLQVVLASAPGLKGSTPADLLKTSVGGSGMLLAGNSLVASQLQRSLSGGSGALGKVNVKRGWDWRSEMSAKTSGEDVMRRLRLGLAKDLASLWLVDADSGVW